MNPVKKTVLMVSGLAALLVCAYFAYNFLSDTVGANNGFLAPAATVTQSVSEPVKQPTAASTAAQTKAPATESPTAMENSTTAAVNSAAATVNSTETSIPTTDNAANDMTTAASTSDVTDEPAVDDRVPAPDFTVLDTDGNEVKLSDMFGIPIVLNFWASWCPPCISEMPEFNTVYSEMTDEIQFMMVDLVDGRRETVEIGKQFIIDNGFTFPVYYDTDGEAAMNYGIMSIPTTLLIDSEGYIVTGAQGAIDADALLAGIELIK